MACCSCTLPPSPHAVNVDEELECAEHMIEDVQEVDEEDEEDPIEKMLLDIAGFSTAISVTDETQ